MDVLTALSAFACSVFTIKKTVQEQFKKVSFGHGLWLKAREYNSSTESRRTETWLLHWDNESRARCWFFFKNFGREHLNALIVLSSLVTFYEVYWQSLQKKRGNCFPIFTTQKVPRLREGYIHRHVYKHPSDSHLPTTGRFIWAVCEGKPCCMNHSIFNCNFHSDLKFEHAKSPREFS